MPDVTKQFVGRAIGFVFLAVVMRVAAPPLPPLRVAFLGFALTSLIVAVFLLVVAATAWGVILGSGDRVDSPR